MKKFHFLNILYYGLALCSCSKSSNSVSNVPSPLNVYVAGYREANGANGNVDTATYWKNGAPVALSNGTSNAHASSIILSGSDIYVTGDMDEGMNNAAVYWVNGKLVTLTNGMSDAFASSVVVSGGNVYVGGYITSVTGKYVGMYWENGKPFPITDSTKNAYVYGIAFSGSDLYLAGFEDENANGFGNTVATYWINDSIFSLTDGTNEAQATAIAVSGTDVYVVGFLYNGNSSQATLWKDGVATTLNDITGSPATYASSIFISGSDVYIAGEGGSGALYWKNGNPTSLLGSQAGASANGIAVSGTSVFVAGNIDVVQFASDSAAYWNNDTLTTLNDGLKYCNASSIFVSTK
jgi:hypothetical protein